MTNLIACHSHIDRVVDIKSAHDRLGVSKIQSKIFHDFFGLKTVALMESDDLETSLVRAINKTLLDTVTPESIDYVVFAHVSNIVAPFFYGLLHRVIISARLKNATYFGCAINKCASTVDAFSLISNLFESEENIRNILLISGDRAFTPQQRYLHNASIAGDAAGAALFSRESSDKPLLKLISFSKQTYSDFYKGAWLDRDRENQFETEFHLYMSNVINDAIAKAALTISDIKYILPHNVNVPVWEKISAELGCSKLKIYTDNISKYGHCFSTDTLVNIASLFSELELGDYVVSASVGFGLTFASAVFQKLKGETDEHICH